MKFIRFKSHYPVISIITLLSVISFLVNRYLYSLEPYMVLKTADFSWLAFVLSHFFHNDVETLFINCMLLLLFGRKIETSNSKRFIIMFFSAAQLSALFTTFFKAAASFSGLEGALYGLLIYASVFKFKADIDSCLDLLVVFPAVIFIMNWNRSHSVVFEFSDNQIFVTEFGGALAGVILFSAAMRALRK